MATDLWTQFLEFLQIPLAWGISVGDLLLAVIILIVGLLVIRVVARGLALVVKRVDLPPLVANFLLRVFRGVLYVILLGLVLAPLGVDLTSLVISFGVLGIVLGLALRDFLGNLIAGITLITVRPFRKGHLVEVAGVTGFVEDVTITATTLKTFDGKRVTVSSTQVWSAPIVDYQFWPIRRIDLVVGVSYEDDVPRALQVLQGLLNGEERVLKEPAPLTNVRDFAESSVDLNLFAWTKQEDWGTVRTDLLLGIKAAFEREGITIPYPTRTILSRAEET